MKTSRDQAGLLPPHAMLRWTERNGKLQYTLYITAYGKKDFSKSSHVHVFRVAIKY